MDLLEDAALFGAGVFLKLNMSFTTLAQEVAYQTLWLHRANFLHQKVGEAMESHFFRAD